MIDLRTASLLDFLPDSIADDPEIAALTKALDPEVQDISQAIVEAIIWPRINDLPERILDALAFDSRLAELALWDLASVAAKRAILRNVFAIRKRSGTRFAVRRIFDLLSLTAEIIEWWQEGAEPFSYRIRIDVTVGGLSQEMVLAIPELLQRFAPTRARGAVSTEAASSGGLLLYPATTIGRYVTISTGRA